MTTLSTTYRVNRLGMGQLGRTQLGGLARVSSPGGESVSDAAQGVAAVSDTPARGSAVASDTAVAVASVSDSQLA